MITPLCNFTITEYNNLIGVHNGREPVRDRHGGSAFRGLMDSTLNERFCLTIQR